MKQIILRYVLIFSFLRSFLSPISASALDLSILGTLSLSQNSSSPLGLGGGLTLGVDLSPFFSLEAGGFFNSFSTFSSSPAEAYNSIQIPVLLRISPIPFLSLHLGPYAGVAMKSGATALDSGIVGGPSLKISGIPLAQLRIDLLYQWGFSDLSSLSLNFLSGRRFVLLAGLFFDFW